MNPNISAAFAERSLIGSSPSAKNRLQHVPLAAARCEDSSVEARDSSSRAAAARTVWEAGAGAKAAGASGKRPAAGARHGAPLLPAAVEPRWSIRRPPKPLPSPAPRN